MNLKQTTRNIALTMFAAAVAGCALISSCSTDEFDDCGLTMAKRKVSPPGENNEDIYVAANAIEVDVNGGPFKVKGSIRFDKQKIKNYNNKLLSELLTIRNSCYFVVLDGTLNHNDQYDITRTMATLNWKDPQESGITLEYSFNFFYHGNDTTITTYFVNGEERSDTAIDYNVGKWIDAEGTQYFNYARDDE